MVSREQFPILFLCACSDQFGLSYFWIRCTYECQIPLNLIIMLPLTARRMNMISMIDAIAQELIDNERISFPFYSLRNLK